MSKFLVDLYSEDLEECIATFNVDDLSDMREGIEHAEEATGHTSDFVLIFNEGSEESVWYVLDENLSLHEADGELSEALDEEYSDDMSEVFESEEGWFEDLLKEEFDELNGTIDESLKRRVSSTGKIKKIKSRKIRRRQATKTTGMSKSSLKRRARKSARTKRRNPGGQRRALKKRKKAMRRRRQMGIR